MRRSFEALPRSNLLWRAALYGLFWGIAINVGEALSLPLGLAGSSRAQLGVMALIGGDWWVVGTALAAIALRLEPALDRHWKLALLVLLTSAGAAVLIEGKWVAIHLLGIDVAAYSRLGAPAPSWANLCYVLWMALFHGGIFIVACVMLQRAERNQRLLGSAQIARRRTEALLDEAELDALRGRVDPAFLLRAMAAVQACYARDVAAADRLLDQLVAFLRSAMPIVRTGSSSLKAEVELARDYAALSAAIDSGSTLWRVHVEGLLPDMAFPPLLLLPLMDHFNSTRDTVPHVPRAARLCIASDAGRVEIVVESPGSADAAERAMALPYRLQVALRTAFGEAWSVQPAALQSGVALRLLVTRRAAEATHEPIAAPHAVIAPVMP